MFDHARRGHGYHLARQNPSAFRPGLPALLLVLLAGLWGAPVTAQTAPLRLVALGDSLTAGWGVAADQAFPAVLEAALRRAGHDVTIVNQGISGDTTAGGVSRVGQALAAKPDGVILELGANDGLRGFDPAFVRANLETMLDALAAQNIPVLFCGMDALANMGRDYGREFRTVYDELAASRNLAYYPFFLEGVFGRRDLNQPDGLHPNADGVREIVRRVLPTAEAFVASLASAKTAVP